MAYIFNLYDLKKAVSKLTSDMTDEEMKSIPIFVGNDEELNGTHYVAQCCLVEKRDYYWYSLDYATTPKVLLLM